MSTDEREVCETCWSWQRSPERVLPDPNSAAGPWRRVKNTWGECRRKLPKISEHGYGQWAKTEDIAWCHKWKPIP